MAPVLQNKLEEENAELKRKILNLEMELAEAREGAQTQSFCRAPEAPTSTVALQTGEREARRASAGGASAGLEEGVPGKGVSAEKVSFREEDDAEEEEDEEPDE